jgi:antitoxin HicB
MKKDLKFYLSLKYPHTVEEYEEDGKTYISLEIPDLPGCGAAGETYEEALAQLKEAKELWIEASLDRGLPIPEPVSEDDFSGKFLLRIPSRLHMDLAKLAKAHKLSLNQYIKSLLENALFLEHEKNQLQKLDDFVLHIDKILNRQNDRIEWLENIMVYLSKSFRSSGPTWLETIISDESEPRPPQNINVSSGSCDYTEAYVASWAIHSKGLK